MGKMEDNLAFKASVDELEIEINNLAHYIDKPEEINYALPRTYQVIAAYNKITEADAETETGRDAETKKVHKHHLRQNKYASNKAYKEKAKQIGKLANARRRKAEKDNEMIYISTGFSAPWGQYTKETVIHNSKLWKPFRKYECVDAD